MQAVEQPIPCHSHLRSLLREQQKVEGDEVQVALGGHIIPTQGGMVKSSVVWFVRYILSAALQENIEYKHKPSRGRDIWKAKHDGHVEKQMCHENDQCSEV